jgi:hypothetical protein
MGGPRQRFEPVFICVKLLQLYIIHGKCICALSHIFIYNSSNTHNSSKINARNGGESPKIKKNLLFILLLSQYFIKEAFNG